MPRKESEESKQVKDFLAKYPDATFKLYAAENPSTKMAPGYFSIIKGKLKDPEAKKVAKAAKAEKPSKVKKEKVEKVAKSKNGNGEIKQKPVKVPTEVVKANKKYETWLETGLGMGWIQNPEKYV